MSITHADARLFRFAILAAFAAIGCADSATHVHPQGGEVLPQADGESASEFAGDPRDVPDGRARLRVNVQSQTGSAPALVLGGMRLCNAGGCVRTDLRTPAVSAASADTATVADILIPAGSYARIAFDSTAPAGDRLGIADSSLKLDQPLVLEAGTRTELFLTLDEHANATATPRFAAANAVALDVEHVALYQPGSALSVRTEDGLEVALNEQSSAEPFVLGVSEADIGGLSKHVSLTPLMDLDIPALVTLPIDRNRMPRGLRLADYEAKLNGTRFEIGSDEGAAAIKLQLDTLGDLRLVSTRPYIETLEGDAFAAAEPAEVAGDGTILKAATDSCTTALKKKLASYKTALSTSQAIRITECEDVFPYVHIVMANMGVGPTAPSPRYPWIQMSSSKNPNGTYPLKTISELVTGWTAKLGINGFTWNGDLGTAANQVATSFNGTVYLAGTQEHSTTKAEAIIGFGSPTSTGTISKLFAKAANTNPSLSPYNTYAQGSTTSIVKGSVCSRTAGEGPYDLWSSIGIGNKRLVMISSATGENGSESFDYCALYAALQSTDAIRLDGGPSAGIYFGGKHLNPLGIAWQVKYGLARRIISAIVAK